MYRLFGELAVHSRDCVDFDLEDCLHVARCTATRFYDEKIPEDCHQHVRNLSTSRRYKTVGMTAVFNSVIHSGILNGRGVENPSVSDQAVARQTWKVLRREVAQARAAEIREDVDYAGLNKILDPARNWSSPTVKTHFKSASATRWVEHHSDSILLEEEMPADAAWWSALFDKHRFARECDTPSKLYIVLPSSNWSVLLVPIGVSSTLPTRRGRWRRRYPTGIPVWGFASSLGSGSRCSTLGCACGTPFKSGSLTTSSCTCSVSRFLKSRRCLLPRDCAR